MTTELTKLEKLNPIELFSVNGIDDVLKRIKKEVSSEVPDVSTPTGRKQIASNAHKIAKSKVVLDDMGKKLADELNAQLKPINSERKKARDYLDSLKDEIRKPLSDWEAAEEKRVEDLRGRIDFFFKVIVDAAECVGDLTVAELKVALTDVENTPIDDSWQEFKGEAGEVKDKTIAQFKSLIEKREVYEQEQAELERLRLEKEAQEKKEAEEKIAKEAAEKARIEAEEKAEVEREKVEQEKLAAEQATKEAEEKLAQAEREKIATEERAKIEAEEAIKREAAAVEKAKQDEIDRQTEKKRQEAAEIEKREANKKHVGKIRKAAKDALMKNGLTEELAKQVVLAINSGEIPHVSISY